MNKLPDLEAWAIFAKVAELGSFAKAAAELGIAQPTVSKALTRLESRLRTTLFHRTSRRMSLTASGAASLERATRILSEGAAVEAELGEQVQGLRGNIRVALPMSFGIRHAAPAIPEFLARHPDVSLDLHFDDEQVDLVAGGFDLALRISNLPGSSLLMRRLCAVRLLLVGSPAYFARYGRPVHPRELATHRALRYSRSRTGEAWRFRHAREGEFTLTVPSALSVDNAEGLMPALRAGLGLALQPEFLAWEDLASGALQAVMPDWHVASIGLHIVTPPGRRRPARVQALIDFLADRFAHAPWAVESEEPGSADSAVSKTPVVG